MKFDEAFKAMCEGKKVKQKCWELVKYIYIKNNKIFCDKDKIKYTIDIEFLLADDWEILEEKPKFTKEQRNYLIDKIFDGIIICSDDDVSVLHNFCLKIRGILNSLCE